MPEFILYALAGIGTLATILAVGWGLFWCIHEYIIDPYYRKQIAEALQVAQRMKDTNSHLRYLLNHSDMKDRWLEELQKMRGND